MKLIIARNIAFMDIADVDHGCPPI